MAKKTPKSENGSGTVGENNVSDEVVSQVGKAVVEVTSLRRSLEQEMAEARTDEERLTLTDQAEVAAVRVIGEQGLTIAEYNEVLMAAQSDPELQERVLLACKAV